MSPRTGPTRRPRLLPAALFASGLVVATAASVLAATNPQDATVPETAQVCADGREWVTVVPSAHDWWKADAASADSPLAGPLLAGCIDTSQLPDAGQPSDSRG